MNALILQSMLVYTIASLAMPWHHMCFGKQLGFLVMRASQGHTRITSGPNCQAEADYYREMKEA